MTSTLDRTSCVKVLLLGDGSLLQSKLFVPEPRSYQIETPEGITYRRTQNHLKPFKSPQKTQTKEQYQQQCPNQKRTPINEDSERYSHVQKDKLKFL